MGMTIFCVLSRHPQEDVLIQRVEHTPAFIIVGREFFNPRSRKALARELAPPVEFLVAETTVALELINIKLEISKGLQVSLAG